jgi:hypothetical protein
MAVEIGASIRSRMKTLLYPENLHTKAVANRYPVANFPGKREE